MIGRAGNPQRLGGASPGVREVAALGERPAEPRARDHSRKCRQSESLLDRVAREQRDAPLEHLDGARIVAQRVVDLTEPVVDLHAQRRVVEPLGDRERLLPELERATLIARHVEIVRHVRTQASEPAFVAKPERERLGIVKARRDATGFAQRHERGAELEQHVDRRREPVTIVRKLTEGGEGPLEVSDGFAVRRARGRALSGAPAEWSGFVPRLRLRCMMCEPISLLVETAGKERLDGDHDPCVQFPPALVKLALVRHLVGERVREGVLELGKESRLVEELRRLQASETTP